MVLQTPGRGEHPGAARYLGREDLPLPAGGPGQDRIEDGVTRGLSTGVNVHVKPSVDTTYLGQSLAATP